MERFDLKKNVEKHGAEAVINSMLKFYEANYLPQKLEKHLDLDLNSSNVVQRIAESTVLLRGSKASLKTLRPILTAIDIKRFDGIAHTIIHKAWFQEHQLQTLHYMIGQMLPVLNVNQRGMFLKIIFSDNCFVYDRYTDPGATTVRRRKGSNMMIPQCVQRAHNRYVELQNMLHEMLVLGVKEVKEQEEPLV